MRGPAGRVTTGQVAQLTAAPVAQRTKVRVGLAMWDPGGKPTMVLADLPMLDLVGQSLTLPEVRPTLDPVVLLMQVRVALVMRAQVGLAIQARVAMENHAPRSASS